MSGICGIYRYDGAPVDPRWLERMRAAMAYYGPDGSSCKLEGPIGMGHLLMEVNPEDAFESQPIRGRRGLMACTARLDNRDALLESFSISSSDATEVSDGQLVSLAYDRWGDELCGHLEGDWAVAAWDAKERRLLLARDIWGINSLYYYQGDGFVAFASSLKALLALPGTQREPDLLRLASILVSWKHSLELTAYKGFHSLPGAHSMTVSDGGQVRMGAFWSSDGRELLRYRREEEYAEAFLEHYSRAVKTCLRSQKPIASTLSGGRDSGSVLILAAPMLASQGRELSAYTSVPYLPPDGAKAAHLGNEWELAHAAAAMAGPNVRHIPIDARGYGVIDGIETFLDICDSPGHAAGNHYWIKAEMEACSQSGAGAVLWGERGNATVSWAGNGSALLALHQRRLGVALRLLVHGEPNPWLAVKRQILRPIVRAGQTVFQRTRAEKYPWRSYSALNVNMAEELDLDGRMRSDGYDPSSSFEPFLDRRREFLVPCKRPQLCYLSEVSAWYGTACLDPTANLALLEFLLRVPDDQFYRKGQSSYLFRRAFRNGMPEAVLAGRRKGLQAADIGHRIVRELPALQDCVDSIESVPLAREMLDIPLLRRCLAELVREVNPETTFRATTILTRGLGVGIFLRRLADSSRSSYVSPPGQTQMRESRGGFALNVVSARPVEI